MTVNKYRNTVKYSGPTS